MEKEKGGKNFEKTAEEEVSKGIKGRKEVGRTVGKKGQSGRVDGTKEAIMWIYDGDLTSCK